MIDPKLARFLLVYDFSDELSATPGVSSENSSLDRISLTHPDVENRKNELEKLIANSLGINLLKIKPSLLHHINCSETGNPCNLYMPGFEMYSKRFKQGKSSLEDLKEIGYEFHELTDKSPIIIAKEVYKFGKKVEVSVSLIN